MNISYDSEADAAYIYLLERERIGVGGVRTSVPVDDDIVLDFDSDERLVGIEVLSARKRLPPHLLRAPSGGRTLGEDAGKPRT
jgi:uncharacterized protein YuzE